MALPLVSAAVVAPAGSPSRQYPAGPSESSRSGTPRSSGPRAQLTWELVRVQLPWLAVAAVAPISGGRFRVRFTALEGAGPLFCTASWYVRLSPMIAGSGETVPLSTRSARGAATVLVRLRLLLVGSGSVSAPVALAVARSVPAALAWALTRSVAPLPAW